MFELSPKALDELAFALGPRAGKGKADLAGATRAGRGIVGTAVAPGSFAASVFRGSTHSQRSQYAIKALQRTASGAPEVTVKITGGQTGTDHVLANFTYISREGWGEENELELETEQGQLITSHDEKLEMAQTWQAREMDDPMRRRGATSISFVLSMPPGTAPEKVRDAAREFAQTEFSQHRWVMALHTDEPHPHVHLTVTRKGAERTRLNPSKEDCFRYRRTFAEKLRDRGVEANATPRRARGITQKADKNALVKMRQRGATPDIDVARLREAQDALSRGGLPSVYEVKAQQDRAVVTAAFNTAIGELRASSEPQHREIAQSLSIFIADMPEPRTRQRALIDEMKAGRGGPTDQMKSADPAPALNAAPLPDSRGREHPTDERTNSFKDRLAAIAKPAPSLPEDRNAEQKARLRAIIDGQKRPPETPAAKSPRARPGGLGAVDRIADRAIERHRDISKDKDPHRGGPGR